ncbi:hypothetical protein DY000_02036398 [Brassica cretica]|uniref:RING-type domain-containing protein n=1 Tax=Brassica cretica TaxID=69181 RepID=A0ABQ7BD90_BRACR|nr:hypothetical protein DY000_02036398 [Brassica cretica]
MILNRTAGVRFLCMKPVVSLDPDVVSCSLCHHSFESSASYRVSCSCPIRKRCPGMESPK